MGFAGTEENSEHTEKERRMPPDKENAKEGCLLLFSSRWYEWFLLSEWDFRVTLADHSKWGICSHILPLFSSKLKSFNF